MMNLMMMNNNPMINQMDQNSILQMIQKNNEQIIKMIHQIFQVQMLNNLLFNNILNNNLNTDYNINNNMFNNNMNQMNNIINDMNMISNQNMQNIMNDSHKNSNNIDLWPGNTAPKVNVVFERIGEIEGIKSRLTGFLVPDNITIKELIETFFKKLSITDQNKQKDIFFMYNGKTLNKADCSTLKENGFDYSPFVSIKVYEFDLRGGQ